MTGPAGAAVALCLALLIAPQSARHRLARVGMTARRRDRALTARSFAAPVTAVAVVGAWVLPAAVVIALAAAGATVWRRRRQRDARRRREKLAQALVAALDVLVGELRTGAHPVAAFSAAATETPGPVGTAFRAVAAGAVLGADVSSGLRSAAADSAKESALAGPWLRLAVCWQLAQTHGLPMAALIRTAQRDIVERTRFNADVIAGMAGARATATLLAALPFVGIALGELIGAHAVRFLLSGHAGSGLLLVGVVLACAGLLWSDRIVGRALL